MTDVPYRRWEHLTTAEFRELPMESVIAVLPVAAVEQHGPHLPTGVDAIINRGILEGAAARLPAGLSVLVLPEQTIGLSIEHTAFAGTLSLGAATVMALWRDIAESVARAGIRKLVFFNSHGGQTEPMTILANELRARHDMLAVTASWFAFGLPDGLVGAAEQQYGIHGGAVETAMMLHLAPALVREQARAAFASSAQRRAADYRHLSPHGRIGFGWQTQDLNPEGVCGDATAADAAMGATLVDHFAAALCELLIDVDRFPLADLRGRPG